MFTHTKEEIIVIPIAHPCLPKWRKRIDEAERRGSFSKSDNKLADNWDACAVGEACSYYPVRRETFNGWDDILGEPLDPVLNKLGKEFVHRVRPRGKNFKRARAIVAAIEARLGELYA